MKATGKPRRTFTALTLAAALGLALSSCTAPPAPTAGPTADSTTSPSVAPFSGQPSPTTASTAPAPATGSTAATAPAPVTGGSALAGDITPHDAGAVQEFDCANPIGTGATLAELNTGTGNPGVPNVLAVTVPAGQTVQLGGTSYEGMRFAKVGLAVKANTPFIISVPDELRGLVRIGWSNSGYTIAEAQTNAGCASPQSGAQWLVYPGGFWLKDPACVPLVVMNGKTTETIHVPVGKSCP